LNGQWVYGTDVPTYEFGSGWTRTPVDKWNLQCQVPQRTRRTSEWEASIVLRTSLFIVALFQISSSSSLAGIPCIIPERWGIEVTGQGAPCQYRFRGDGSLDQLIVYITARDCFDVPVPVCSTSATITPTSGTLALCTCAPNPQWVLTGVDGTGTFVFDHIGGRGTADLCITAHCVGDIAIFCEEFDFTSPDLDASCETAAPATNILDLGVWAGCLPPNPYCQAADFDCDGTVNVVDVGFWAGGLGVPCELQRQGEPGPRSLSSR